MKFSSSPLPILAGLSSVAHAITITGYVSIPCYVNSIVVATCSNIPEVSKTKNTINPSFFPHRHPPTL
jgi:hypothetical protein